MPTVKKQIVMSHEIVEFDEKDKAGNTTGKKIKKHKYIFLNRDGSKSVGFDENGLYASDVKNVGTWDESLAQDIPWDIREYQGTFTEKLTSGEKKFSDDARKK